MKIAAIMVLSQLLFQQASHEKRVVKLYIDQFASTTFAFTSSELSADLCVTLVNFKPLADVVAKPVRVSPDLKLYLSTSTITCR